MIEQDALTAPPLLAPEVKERSAVVRWAVIVAIGMVLLAAARAIADTPALTSSDTFGATLRLAVPIGLVGLGALYAERAGVVNIGLEGMMILGTWFGAWGGVEFGPWWGVVIGILGGAAGGLLHAVATVTFGVDHIVSGVAINILGAGAARFLSVVAYTEGSGGGATQSPRVTGNIGEFSVPLVGGFLEDLEDRGWFLVSDVAALLRGLTTDVSWLALLAVALVPFTWWVLWRTAFGLRLRSAGENPVAADSLGVPVYRMKYIGVVVSGALAGMGGAFLVLEQAQIYREGQTGGRGFIGLAALIFGNWRPGGVGIGASLFGFADALQLRASVAVHSLLLFLCLVLGALAVVAIVRRRTRQAILSAAGSLAFLAWFASTDDVPGQLVDYTPHLVTLVVLAFFAQRLRMPAADGLPYRKGQQL